MQQLLINAGIGLLWGAFMLNLYFTFYARKQTRISMQCMQDALEAIRIYEEAYDRLKRKYPGDIK